MRTSKDDLRRYVNVLYSAMRRTKSIHQSMLFSAPESMDVHIDNLSDVMEDTESILKEIEQRDDITEFVTD